MAKSKKRYSVSRKGVGGPKPKPLAERRVHAVMIRLTTAEWRRARKAADNDGVSLGEFAREAVTSMSLARISQLAVANH